MAWCGCSRKGRQSLASSGGGGAGWSVSTSTPYILWRRLSSKALRPFSGDVYGWVFCAKNWQLERCPMGGHEGLILGQVFWDLGLAIGPVVEAGEIPDERRVVSRLCGAI